MPHVAGPAGGSGLVDHGVSVQMKRPGEFTGIQPITAPGGHAMPGQEFTCEQYEVVKM